MNPRKRENEYLVQWETKPQTWEAASHLDTCQDLIKSFEDLLAKQKEKRLKAQAEKQQQQQDPQVKSPAAKKSEPEPPVAEVAGLSTPRRTIMPPPLRPTQERRRANRQSGRRVAQRSQSMNYPFFLYPRVEETSVEVSMWM